MPSGERRISARPARIWHRALDRFGLTFRRPGRTPGGRWLPYRDPDPALPPSFEGRLLGKGDRARIALERITASPGFSYAADGWHPYVATLREYMADPGLRCEDSSLHRTLTTFTPPSAQAALFEDVERPLEPLHRLPPRVAGHEWLLTAAEASRALDGHPPRWMVRGKRPFGPVEGPEVRDRFEQLLRVYRSVRDHGLCPELAEDPVRGFLLVRDDAYRFVLTGGQHRVAAAQALGEREVEVRLDWVRAVRHDELHRWTRPHGGPYPRDVADLLFERLFRASGRTKADNLGLRR